MASAWRADAPTLEPEDVVVVDESDVLTNMARLYGRVSRGQRARGAVSHGRWGRYTVQAWPW